VIFLGGCVIPKRFDNAWCVDNSKVVTWHVIPAVGLCLTGEMVACVMQTWRAGVSNTRQKTAVGCTSASPSRQRVRLSSAASLISCVWQCASRVNGVVSFHTRSCFALPSAVLLRYHNFTQLAEQAFQTQRQSPDLSTFFGTTWIYLIHSQLHKIHRVPDKR